MELSRVLSAGVPGCGWPQRNNKSLPMSMASCTTHQERNDAVLACLQASKGRVAIISLLLKAGAKVNAQDSTGSTPLHR